MSRLKSSISPMTQVMFADSASRTSATSSTDVLAEIVEQSEESKGKQIGKMILVILIPVVALIAKASTSFTDSLAIQREASVLGEVIKYALFATDGIALLQRERGLTAVYLGADQEDFVSYRKLASARLKSNEFLLRFTAYDRITLPGSNKIMRTGKQIIVYLDVIREKVDIRTNTTLLQVIDLYTNLNNALIKDSLQVSLVPSRQEIWPLVVSYSTISRAIDLVGIQRGIGGAAFSACDLSQIASNIFIILDAKYKTLLTTSFKFYPIIKRRYDDDMNNAGKLTKDLTEMKEKILSNDMLKEICKDPEKSYDQGNLWFVTATKYMAILTDVQKNVTGLISIRVPVIDAAAQRGMAAYLTVMIAVTFICMILSVWYSIRLNEMNSKVRDAVIKVRTRAEEVKEEKKKTDFLLYQMMPKRVADTLKMGVEVTPEWFDAVTIYFSDILGWADLCIKCSPHQIVTLLNNLYKDFDNIIEKYDVYKVETIADSYMCVSGLPEKSTEHAKNIAQLALEMMKFARTFQISHLPGVPLSLRIGFHSGPCVAGVVGTKMPRYCLFGDTVNTASRMETNGEAFKIHITEASQRLLEKIGGFDIQYRGRIPIKGKGEMATYWLVRQAMRMESPKKRVQINGNQD